jgi:hypothetical protein
MLHLRSPTIPEARKAVDEQDDRALSSFHAMDPVIPATGKILPIWRASAGACVRKSDRRALNGRGFPITGLHSEYGPFPGTQATPVVEVVNSTSWHAKQRDVELAADSRYLDGALA